MKAPCVENGAYKKKEVDYIPFGRHFNEFS